MFGLTRFAKQPCDDASQSSRKNVVLEIAAQFDGIGAPGEIDFARIGSVTRSARRSGYESSCEPRYSHSISAGSNRDASPTSLESTNRPAAR